MADRKISDLTALTAQASGDLLPIVDVSEAAAADKNKSITVEELFRGIPVNVGVGTASPSNFVHLSGSSATQWVQIDGSDSNLLIGQNTGSTHFGITDGTKLMANNASHPFAIGNNQAQPLILGTSSLERVRIDSSGRLLVGTTSTSQNSIAVFQGNNAGSDGAGIVHLAKGSTTPADGDFLGTLSFTDSGHVQAARVTAHRDGGTWTSGSSQPTRLAFSTTADGASSVTERMRIDSSGKLFTDRTVSNTTGDHPAVEINTDSTGTAASSFATGIDFQTEGTTRNRLAVTTNNNWIFYRDSGSNEALRIDSSGRVGIGASSPAFKFQINNSGTTPATIASFRNTALDYVYMELYDQTGNSTYLGSESGKFVIQTPGSSYATKFCVTSAGDVGIGTTSPAFSNGDGLEIARSGTACLRVEGDSGNKAAEIYVDSTGTTIDSRGTSARTNFAIGGNSKMLLDNSGRLGIGTSSPYSVAGANTLSVHNSSGNSEINFLSSTSGFGALYFGDATSGTDRYAGYLEYKHGDDYMRIATGSVERMRIESSGDVGINTTSPDNKLHVVNGIDSDLILKVNGADTTTEYIGFGVNTGEGVLVAGGSGTTSNALVFKTSASGTESERARIDSSGRLLVGSSSSTSVASKNSAIQVNRTHSSTLNASILIREVEQNTAWPALFINKNRDGQAMQTDNRLGAIEFAGDTGSSDLVSAKIDAEAEAGWSTSSLPSRLVFSTTASSSTTPTERMRITSGGDLLFGKTGDNFGTAGAKQKSTGALELTADGTFGLAINRLTDDGELVRFYQATTQEGSITVSGTTVSYNGAHLARWSQLAGGVERTEILRGSVLSNIDEMCTWGEEENEQLNRMKVSDVEGDKNVSGVFQAWDDDDDTYTNDFYCAMTGDFVIRIAQGVTVERGDLLMSAGDGTAKPQDDDIIRSKTIAKVTSTNVSCTYDDGSYCVPCVLMAC